MAEFEYISVTIWKSETETELMYVDVNSLCWI